ncbi:hypothetical protein [Thiococcus pfennigii]|uniref:hypothetical protein n=1 Tax=Thiococcus pfennigii TaxID=1057 RepID=UPI001907D788|nr:hypothetical protein [Thiococcus pfennigii]MBK1701974.1 hypothetical protein [Thiococcus pfennigii]MBK1732978.1 hypothetical protein [Thiococcus pfennigii]
MLQHVHRIAAALALLTILTFWLATLIAETLGQPATVVAVKTAIPWGFFLLIPALATAGGSGLALAKRRTAKRVAAKRRRMPIVAANGLLVLIPCALFLSVKARAGEFDAPFYAVQAVELVAGAVNIALLALSLRDGLRLSGRLGGAPPA